GGMVRRNHRSRTLHHGRRRQDHGNCRHCRAHGQMHALRRLSPAAGGVLLARHEALSLRRDGRGGNRYHGRTAASRFPRRQMGMKQAVDILVEKLGGLKPDTAIVLGSGLGNLVDDVEDAIRIPYVDLPGFPRGGVSGHASMLVGGRFGGRPVVMLAGRAHYYENGNAAVMRPALETLAGIGVSRLILTNAAGSPRPALRPCSVMRPALEALAGIGVSRLILTKAAGSLDPAMPPGSVMLVTDHINFSGTNPLFGEPTDRRFVGLTEAYDAGMRAAIEKAASAVH